MSDLSELLFQLNSSLSHARYQAERKEIEESLERSRKMVAESQELVRRHLGKEKS